MFLVDGIKRFLPRLFSALSHEKVILPAALGLNLLDGLSTWLCLKRSGMIGTESNPMLAFFLKQFGIGMGLFVGKIFFGSIIIIFFLKKAKNVNAQRWKVIFIFALLLLCINNFMGFIFAGPA